MSEKGYNKRIEEMYKEKQRRIAKQIALREARETVSLWAATSLKDPAVVADKVVEIAEKYFKWLEERE